MGIESWDVGILKKSSSFATTKTENAGEAVRTVYGGIRTSQCIALKKGSEREHKVLAAFLRMYHFPNNSNFIVRLFP